MNRKELKTSIAIVGAGQAAARTAHELRALGFTGSITLIGAELHAPYERPPLSKAALQADDVAPTPVLSAAAMSAQQIELLAGRCVTSLDLAQHRLVLDDGRIVEYERCVLATGGTVRTLPQLAPGSPRTHYLRTLEDAQGLRQCLRTPGSLAVIGGGFLGLEAALSARQSGMQVTVVESAPGLLGRFLPPELSDWIAHMLTGQGITLHLGRQLDAAHAGPDSVQLQLQDGTRMETDSALVAIGLLPEVALARAAGLHLDPNDGGIAVAEDGRSSHPDVFAAGDCATQFRPYLGRMARLESWQNANEQAKAVAAGLLDQKAPVQAYPWFWTDLGEHNLQMLGLKAPDLHYVQRRHAAGPQRGVWLGLKDGVPVHGVALNAGADLRALRPLFERAIGIDPLEFTDPATDLRAWTKSLVAGAATAIST